MADIQKGVFDLAVAKAKDFHDASKKHQKGSAAYEAIKEAAFKHFVEMEKIHGVGSDIANETQRWANQLAK